MSEYPPILMDPPDFARYVKRGGRKKPFRLQCRYARRVLSGDTKWRTCGRYATERDQLNALAQLRKSHSTLFGEPWMEFRIPEPKAG